MDIREFEYFAIAGYIVLDDLSYDVHIIPDKSNTPSGGDTPEGGEGSDTPEGGEGGGDTPSEGDDDQDTQNAKIFLSTPFEVTQIG